ncbi:MAG TPA: hypothetical protein VFW94_01850 [Candidatus Acidoferrales bacterium]|nr:hypothetical protein [Candidatus Acidoferrales bacterium]
MSQPIKIELKKSPVVYRVVSGTKLPSRKVGTRTRKEPEIPLRYLDL